MNNNFKVKQFIHANQFIIRGEHKVIFQSYDSTIAIIEYTEDGQVLTLGCDWDYSNTTLKHLYMFLGEYLSYNFKGLNEYSLTSELNASRNKRAYIQKCIDKDIIKYDEGLR